MSPTELQREDEHCLADRDRGSTCELWVMQASLVVSAQAVMKFRHALARPPATTFVQGAVWGGEHNHASPRVYRSEAQAVGLAARAPADLEPSALATLITSAAIALPCAKPALMSVW
jgi:hypothetical protein